MRKHEITVLIVNSVNNLAGKQFFNAIKTDENFNEDQPNHPIRLMLGDVPLRIIRRSEDQAYQPGGIPSEATVIIASKEGRGSLLFNDSGGRVLINGNNPGLTITPEQLIESHNESSLVIQQEERRRENKKEQSDYEKQLTSLLDSLLKEKVSATKEDFYEKLLSAKSKLGFHIETGVSARQSKKRKRIQIKDANALLAYNKIMQEFEALKSAFCHRELKKKVDLGFQRLTNPLLSDVYVAGKAEALKAMQVLLSVDLNDKNKQTYIETQLNILLENEAHIAYRMLSFVRMSNTQRMLNDLFALYPDLKQQYVELKNRPSVVSLTDDQADAFSQEVVIGEVVDESTGKSLNDQAASLPEHLPSSKAVDERTGFVGRLKNKAREAGQSIMRVLFGEKTTPLPTAEVVATVSKDALKAGAVDLAKNVTVGQVAGNPPGFIDRIKNRIQQSGQSAMSVLFGAFKKQPEAVIKKEDVELYIKKHFSDSLEEIDSHKSRHDLLKALVACKLRIDDSAKSTKNDKALVDLAIKVITDEQTKYSTFYGRWSQNGCADKGLLKILPGVRNVLCEMCEISRAEKERKNREEAQKVVEPRQNKQKNPRPAEQSKLSTNPSGLFSANNQAQVSRFDERLGGAVPNHHLVALPQSQETSQESEPKMRQLA